MSACSDFDRTASCLKLGYLNFRKKQFKKMSFNKVKPMKSILKYKAGERHEVRRVI